MFSVRYVGNWVIGAVLAVAAVATFTLPTVAHASDATVLLGRLVSAFAVAGVVVLALNAILGRAPLLDWSAPGGTHLHPRAKAALQGLGVALVALVGLLAYVSIFVFGLYDVLYFGLFMVVVMMSWIIYVTAGKHYEND